jgi:hypothetical protein
MRANFRADVPPVAASLPIVSAAPILFDAQAVFDFVRSIRVFEITYKQHRSSDGDCNSWGSLYMGSYGEQGDYT